MRKGKHREKYRYFKNMLSKKWNNVSHLNFKCKRCLLLEWAWFCIAWTLHYNSFWKRMLGSNLIRNRQYRTLNDTSIRDFGVFYQKSLWKIVCYWKKCYNKKYLTKSHILLLSKNECTCVIGNNDSTTITGDHREKYYDYSS